MFGLSHYGMTPIPSCYPPSVFSSSPVLAFITLYCSLLLPLAQGTFYIRKVCKLYPVTIDPDP